jgi:hypothetical protein
VARPSRSPRAADSSSTTAWFPPPDLRPPVALARAERWQSPCRPLRRAVSWGPRRTRLTRVPGGDPPSPALNHEPPVRCGARRLPPFRPGGRSVRQSRRAAAVFRRPTLPSASPRSVYGRRSRSPC